MDRETFDKILTEEGIDSVKMRNDIWSGRPPGDLDEEKLRGAAKKLKQALPGLQVKQALGDAIAREYGWDR